MKSYIVHPFQLMTDAEKDEIEVEWNKLVEEMNLRVMLGTAGCNFASHLFIEAYSRGFGKAKGLGVLNTGELDTAKENN